MNRRDMSEIRWYLVEIRFRFGALSLFCDWLIDTTTFPMMHLCPNVTLCECYIVKGTLCNNLTLFEVWFYRQLVLVPSSN